ncbi:hypothetical protein [Flavobacterium flavipallidum]|uniref:Uncharacterized protein n=1 Tax=Flavobacterium flavipallidum TaxID=3139140 RepID=A0ABU9HQH7_9FLAO
MKTIIIILTSMITTMFYAQNQEEIELYDSFNNNTVLSAIPSLAGKDYFILGAKAGQIAVISKIDNNYTYYNIEIGGLGETTIVATKAVSYKPVLDKIFTNFVPKAGVKRYLSDYGISLDEHILGVIYFAIYKNGTKIFDYCLPGILQSNSKESPIEDEVFGYLVDVMVDQGKL